MMNTFTISSQLNKNKVFILKKSELGKRLDPLYYASNIFGFLKTTNYKIKSIREVVEYTISGFGVGREDQDLTENGFIQIRPTNLDEFGNLKFDRNIYLEDKYLESKKSNIIQKNDILFNNTNSQELVGKTAFFDLDGSYFHSNHITRIRVNEHIIRPKYLWILLNLYQERKIFYTLCTNWNNQSGVGIELLNSIKIIIPSFEIQDKVIAIKENSIKCKQQNESQVELLFTSIDDYLLKELGITLPPLPENTLKNRTFISTLGKLSGNRLDPFYYDTSFDELLDRINNGKFVLDKIGSISNIIDTGKTPPKSDYLENNASNTFPIIKVGSYSGDYIDISKSDFVKSNFCGNTVSQGDIFILGAAHQAEYVGKKVYYLDEEPKQKTFFVGELVRISTNPNKCDSAFLFSLLKTKIYMSLLNREKRGQTSHLYPNDVKHIFIPIPPIEKQKEIADHIAEIRKQAQELKDKTTKALAQANKEIENILLN